MDTCIVFTKPNEVQLESFSLGALSEGKVRLRTIVSLISAGTESRCLSGNFAPGTHWDNWVKYPFRPGYSSVAVVEEAARDVETLSPGDIVAVRPKHASAHIASASGCCKLDSRLDPQHAVWFALAKIALVGQLAAGDMTGRRVAIIGTGPIGQMAVRWASTAGPLAIAAIDFSESRLQTAATGGADITIDAGSGDAVEQLRKNFRGQDDSSSGADIVIDTTGNPRAFSSALQMAARKGRVVVLGDVGDPSQQHLSSDVIIKGLTVVGAHDCHSGGDWPAERMNELFFSHLLSGRINMDKLNTHSFNAFDAEQVRQAYKTAASPQTNNIGILLNWSQAADSEAAAANSQAATV